MILNGNFLDFQLEVVGELYNERKNPISPSTSHIFSWSLLAPLLKYIVTRSRGLT